MNGNPVAPAPTLPSTQGQDSDSVGFFQEDNGNYSSMRLMSMVALIAAVMFGTLTIFGAGGPNNAGNGIYITSAFLIAAFAPKAVQKFAEQKMGGNK
jgi:hypothetical protein